MKKKSKEEVQETAIYKLLLQDCFTVFDFIKRTCGGIPVRIEPLYKDVHKRLMELDFIDKNINED
jgi:hypothetical protein